MLGGIEKYEYKDLIDIYHCYHKRPEKMVNYKEFDTMAKLEDHAKKTVNIDLYRKVKMMKNCHSFNFPSIIETIYNTCEQDEASAEIVFAIVDQTKSYEFETVILMDDFVPVPITDLRFGLARDFICSKEDKNALYLAMTRSCGNLVINSSIFNLKVISGDAFENVAKAESVKMGRDLPCINCKESTILENNSLLLQSTPYKCYTTQKLAGIFCSVCSTSTKFTSLKIKASVTASRMHRDKNREFLRYFVGVLPEKFMQVIEFRRRNIRALQHMPFGQFFHNADFFLPIPLALDSSSDDEVLGENLEKVLESHQALEESRKKCRVHKKESQQLKAKLMMLKGRTKKKKSDLKAVLEESDSDWITSSSDSSDSSSDSDSSIIDLIFNKTRWMRRMQQRHMEALGNENEGNDEANEAKNDEKEAENDADNEKEPKDEEDEIETDQNLGEKK